MPRYVFETNDNEQVYSAELEADDDQAARQAILAAFPDMARGLLPDGDKRRFYGAVRNQDGKLIYRATMTLVGEWEPVEDR